MRVPSFAEWIAGGSRVEVRAAPDGPAVHLFCRVEGDGPWLTFWHGFPTSSWDWTPLLALGTLGRRWLLFDFLGFGDSDKPLRHCYSLTEQADLAEAVWRRFGVTRTALVAHDYGVSVAQEILARQAEGRLGVELERVILLNGGLYPALHRPRLIQRALRVPLLGALVTRLLSPRAFRRSFRAVLAPSHPPSDWELAQCWDAIAHRDGYRRYHRLIRYLDDRRRHRQRWEEALDRTTVPLDFVWGLLDPVSGAHMAAEIRRRRPGAKVTELADVGHYPQLEAPERVSQAIRTALA